MVNAYLLGHGTYGRLRGTVSMRLRLCLVALLAGPLPVDGFQLEQLTCVPPTCGVWQAQMAGDGRRMVVSSTCDLVPGANPDGNAQLFLRDVEGATLVQLTPAHPTGGLGRQYDPQDCSLSTPDSLAIDHVGDRVVAIARCSASGERERERLLDYGAGRQRVGPWVPCFLRLLPDGLSPDGKRLVIDADCHPLRGRRRTYRPRVYVQDAHRRGFKRLQPGRCESFWAAVNDAGVVVLNSNCPEYVGPNPRRVVQLVALDLVREDVRRLTHVIGAGCGGFSVAREGIIIAPAMSAAGHVAINAGCIDAAGPVLPNAPNEVLFLAQPGDVLQQATSDYCVTRPGGNDGSLGHGAIDPPVSLSADGSAIAFAMRCGVGAFPESDRRVMVVRPPDTSRTIEVASIRDPSARFAVSPPSMDAAGRSLVFTSDAPIGGCANDGAQQLYLARGLDDPSPGPTICACPP